MSNKIKIYLDNCCFNRPYDDQSQLLISLETQAKLRIQHDIKEGKLELVDSYILRYENSENPYIIRKDAIKDFLDKNGKYYVPAKLERVIKQNAMEIIHTGIKFKDACHIACAVYAGCDYLVTTDKRMLKYKSDKIEIIDPVRMIGILEDDENE